MGGVNSDVVGFGSIRRGRLFIENRCAFDESIRRFRDDTPVQIEVTARRATRSIQANRFYWGVIVQSIADYTGYTPDEVHDFLKAKFLPKKLAMCDGNGEVVDEFVVGGSTRILSVADFDQYCRQCEQWAAETLGIEAVSEEPAAHGWGV